MCLHAGLLEPLAMLLPAVCAYMQHAAPGAAQQQHMAVVCRTGILDYLIAMPGQADRHFCLIFILLPCVFVAPRKGTFPDIRTPE